MEKLFKKGGIYHTKSLLCYYLPWKEIAMHQIMVIVAKKHIKKATGRNKIKRRIRETYRLSQHMIALNLVQSPLLLAFIFKGKNKENESYKMLAQSMQKIMIYLCNKYGKTLNGQRSEAP